MTASDDLRRLQTTSRNLSIALARSPGDHAPPRFPLEPPSLACAKPRKRAKAAEGASASLWWARAILDLQRSNARCHARTSVLRPTFGTLVIPRASAARQWCGADAGPSERQMHKFPHLRSSISLRYMLRRVRDDTGYCSLGVEHQPRSPPIRPTRNVRDESRRTSPRSGARHAHQAEHEHSDRQRVFYRRLQADTMATVPPSSTASRHWSHMA